MRLFVFIAALCLAVSDDCGSNNFEHLRDKLWDKTLLESQSSNDACHCYVALHDGKCGSNGGVYRISKSWFTAHEGGAFKNKNNGYGTCGREIENWTQRRSSNHSFYADALALGGNLNSFSSEYAFYVSEYNCETKWVLTLLDFLTAIILQLSLVLFLRRWKPTSMQLCWLNVLGSVLQVAFNSDYAAGEYFTHTMFFFYLTTETALFAERSLLFLPLATSARDKQFLKFCPVTFAWLGVLDSIFRFVLIRPAFRPQILTRPVEGPSQVVIVCTVLLVVVLCVVGARLLSQYWSSGRKLIVVKLMYLSFCSTVVGTLNLAFTYFKNTTVGATTADGYRNDSTYLWLVLPDAALSLLLAVVVLRKMTYNLKLLKPSSQSSKKGSRRSGNSRVRGRAQPRTSPKSPPIGPSSGFVRSITALPRPKQPSLRTKSAPLTRAKSGAERKPATRASEPIPTQKQQHTSTSSPTIDDTAAQHSSATQQQQRTKTVASIPEETTPAQQQTNAAVPSPSPTIDV